MALLISGPPGTGKTLLAEALASELGRPMISVSCADVPERDAADAAVKDLFAEAVIHDALLLFEDSEALFGTGERRRAGVLRSLEQHDGLAILATSQPEMLDHGLDRRVAFHLRLDLPEPPLRRQIWEVHLPPELPLASDIDLDVLAATYDFSGGTIRNAVLMAVSRAIERSPDRPTISMTDMDEGCRDQVRHALEALAIPTSTTLRLADVVLPDEAARKVREVVACIRNQATLVHRWGFGRRLVTGRGIAVLFDGPPGTGKTLCAEVIAGEFARPLYRVDLPQVVSKWVGETEKNIRAIFQQARISQAMLLFDEADALFGSRVAEPRTATDRYANMEVNLLLQEIERFPGVAILTTNSVSALDAALLRRIQVRVTFQEPDADQRRRIWETLCPAETPRGPDVDFERLGHEFELSGGLIKNALLRAAYRACDERRALSQADLRDSCIEECRSSGRLARLGGQEGAKRRVEVAQ